jgi:hypothetical protein
VAHGTGVIIPLAIGLGMTAYWEVSDVSSS